MTNRGGRLSAAAGGPRRRRPAQNHKGVPPLRSPSDAGSPERGKAGHQAKPAPRRLELLTPDEVGQIVRHAYRSRGPAGARDAALILLLYRGGLRIAEALALLPVDVDGKTGDVTVHRGKGGRRRRVRLDAGSVAVIERWKVRRARVGATAHQPLICTISDGRILTPGRPLGRDQVLRMLRRRAAACGIQKRVHPHGLRHSYASALVVGGASVETARVLLGHASLRTTQTYLQGLSPEEHLAAGVAALPPMPALGRA